MFDKITRWPPVGNDHSELSSQQRHADIPNYDYTWADEGYIRIFMAGNKVHNKLKLSEIVYLQFTWIPHELSLACMHEIFDLGVICKVPLSFNLFAALLKNV